MNPKKTGAIIVGIEKYEAGTNWNLNGPAHDACNFTNWLRDRQVPLENIHLFILSLSENREFIPKELSFEEAAEHNITNFIEKELTQYEYDLLYLHKGFVK